MSSTYDILTPEWRNTIAQCISQEFSLRLLGISSVDCPRAVSTLEAIGGLHHTVLVKS